MKLHLKRPLTGRRMVVAGIATAVLLGGAGAATAAALNDGGDHRTSSTADHDTGEDSHEDGTTHHSDNGNDRTQDRALLNAAKIDIKQATDTALKSVPGTTATSAELEKEHGTVVWQVDVTNGKSAEHEVSVDAGNGKVLSNTTDRADDNDDGDHDD